MRKGLKNSNNESMKLTKSGIDGMRASVVPLGRAGYDTDFPGTKSLAVRCRFATLRNRGRIMGGGGKRRVGTWGFTAISGREIGKWCSFSHLETALTRLSPDKFTQVVDFPHLAMVRHFLDANFTNERELEKAKQRQAELGTKVGRLN